MPKIVYEDGREVEVSVVSHGYSPENGNTITVSKKEEPYAILRDDLVYIMNARQRANLLPFEIVQGMLLHIGSSDFADDLVAELEYVRDYTAYNEHEFSDLPKVTAKKLLKKWGFR